MPPNDGSKDVARVADALAARLPEALDPIAELALNLWWSWHPGGEELFRDLDPHRWAHSHGSPIRLLQEISSARLEEAAAEAELTGRARELRDAMRADLGRPRDETVGAPERPVAFFCTEFGVHGSLPLYAGGLGVLAGDYLKEASDRALPILGVGLFYHQGYFHQRLDPSGWQHEYWTPNDPDRLPMVTVTDGDDRPLRVTVPLWGREVAVEIRRVDVGSVPLYLLDAELPENATIDAWTTSRLYVGDRRFRLAQYALLGIGGVRALRALGYDPSAVHLNEGHAAIALLELLREEVRAGRSLDDATEAVRRRTVFTTHTPVAAGNESYPADWLLQVLGDLPAALGTDEGHVLGFGRVHPHDPQEAFGLTPAGLRLSRFANGVSRRHGEVARTMWRELYPDREPDDVPIAHVTNGVHLPTWTARPMRELLEAHLGPEWIDRTTDPEVWAKVDAIPDEDLWEVRRRQREGLVAHARERALVDRLARGEPVEYVEAAAEAFDPEALTIGFARRAALYKRLYLLAHDPDRAAALVGGERPVQVLLAGKPHPADEEAKRLIQRIFELKGPLGAPGRIAYLEDYDLPLAKWLVAGCDLWVNVPRPPMEASGTSGMKVALNGGLNLSVLDGWWAEAYDGTNGWAIDSDPNLDPGAQDAADAATLYDLLEHEVLPAFSDRDEAGVPRAWMARMKASIKTAGTHFTATRMLDDYVRRAYRVQRPGAGAPSR